MNKPDLVGNKVTAQFSEQIIEATRTQTKIRIKGGDSKQFYGNAWPDKTKTELIDASQHQGIISYIPAELVMKVKAGTNLAEIEQTLAQQNQMLAWEPPHFSNTATIGGAIASGLSGSRRYQAGSCSDFVLGCTMLDASGQSLHFGGEVMKNVAGFDMSRLMAGSLGTLGLLLDVSVKVLPKPSAELTLKHPCPFDYINQFYQEWRSKPIPISGLAWVPTDAENGNLYIRLSGAQVMLDHACSHLPGGKLGREESVQLWNNIKEHTHEFFTGVSQAITSTQDLWRVALPPLTENLHLGPCLVDLGGTLRWYKQKLDAQQLREKVTALGGHATLFRYANANDIPEGGVFQKPSATVFKLNQQVKNRLDPQGLFNPDRLYIGL